MRLFFIALLVSFTVSAQASVTTIETETGGSVISIPGTIQSVLPHIEKLDNGLFGIKVTVAFRSYGKTVVRHVFSFPVTELVSFVQRGKDLYIIHQGQETLMAHHEWWYSSYWSVSNKNIQIKTNLKKLSSNRFSLNPQILIFE